MTVMHSLYREPGTVNIEGETCKSCGQCARICPAEVLTVDDGSVRISDDSVFGCIACGHCMMVCPQGAVAVTGGGISSDDLLPLPLPEERATADALAALMRARRSVRRFRKREVEPELLDRVVEMAASAPMGIPPRDVGCVTVSGRNKVQELPPRLSEGTKGSCGSIVALAAIGHMRVFISCGLIERGCRRFIPNAACSVAFRSEAVKKPQVRLRLTKL